MPTSLSVSVYLATNPAQQAVVKVHPSFSWNVLMEAISACLHLDEDNMIQWLILVDVKGQPLSSSISSISRFQKMCEMWGSTVTTELLTFEVHLAEPLEDISLDSKNHKATESNGGKSMRITAPDLGAAAKPKEIPQIIKTIPRPVRHDLRRDRGSVFVRLKLRCDASCVGDVSLAHGITWESITKSVINALCLDPASRVASMTLMDADGDRVSATVNNANVFWKVIDNTYDQDDGGMVFEVALSDRDERERLLVLKKTAEKMRKIAGRGADPQSSIPIMLLKIRSPFDIKTLIQLKISKDMTWDRILQMTEAALNLPSNQCVDSFLVVDDGDVDDEEKDVYRASISNLKKLKKMYEVCESMSLDLVLDAVVRTRREGKSPGSGPSLSTTKGAVNNIPLDAESDHGYSIYSESAHGGASTYSASNHGLSTYAQSVRNPSVMGQSEHGMSMYDDSVHLHSTVDVAELPPISESEHGLSAYGHSSHGQSEPEMSAHGQNDYLMSEHGGSDIGKSVHSLYEFDQSEHGLSAYGYSAHGESVYDLSEHGPSDAALNNRGQNEVDRLIEYDLSEYEQSAHGQSVCSQSEYVMSSGDKDHSLGGPLRMDQSDHDTSVEYDQSAHGFSVHGHSAHGDSLDSQSGHGDLLGDQSEHAMSAYGQSVHGQSEHGFSVFGESEHGRADIGQSEHYLSSYETTNVLTGTAQNDEETSANFRTSDNFVANEKQHSAQEDDDITLTKTVSTVSGSVSRPLCYIKLKLGNDDSSVTELQISWGSSWIELVTAISSTYKLSQEYLIHSLTLIDSDGDSLHQGIKDTATFWKTHDNIYDDDENMVYEIVLFPVENNNKIEQKQPAKTPENPQPVKSKKVAKEEQKPKKKKKKKLQNNQKTDEKKLDAIQEEEEPQNTQKTDETNRATLQKVEKQIQLADLEMSEDVSMSSLNVIRVCLAIDYSTFHKVRVPFDNSWESIAFSIASTFDYKMKSEMHRLVLKDGDGSTISSLITTQQKFDYLLKNVYDIQLNMFFIAYFDDMTYYDNIESSPLAYKNLRCIEPMEGQLDILNRFIISKNSTPPQNVKKIRLPKAIVGSLEDRVLTSIDKARRAMRNFSSSLPKRAEANVASGSSQESIKKAAVEKAAEELYHRASSSVAESAATAATTTSVNVAPSVPAKVSFNDISIRMRLACDSTTNAEILVLPDCNWVKLLEGIALGLRLQSVEDIESLTLVGEDNERLSPVIANEQLFWKIYRRTYKRDNKTCFVVNTTIEATNRIVAAFLCGSGAMIDSSKTSKTINSEGQENVSIRVRLYGSNIVAEIQVLRSCSWDTLVENTIHVLRVKDLGVTGNVTIDKLTLLDGEGDQVSPAVRNGLRFWKVFEDAYDHEEGMLFEVVTCLSSTTTNTMSGNASVSNVVAKPSVTVRVCSCRNRQKIYEIEVIKESPWAKLAVEIAKVLKPMHPSWVQRLVLIDKIGRILEKPVEDGPSFWKAYSNSYHVTGEMVFEVHQSLYAEDVGKVNAGGYLTTSSGELLAGPDVHTLDLRGLQAIHLASVANNLPMVTWLLNAGCLVDATDCHGMTALHYACDGRRIELALYLVSRGASVLCSNKIGLTPLHFICLRGIVELGSLLRRQYLNVASSSGLSLLHCACDEGHLSIVRKLLETGALVDARDNDGLTALHYACVNGHLEVAMALVEFGAFVNARDDDGMSPLLYACSEGHLEIAQWLVTVGASLKARNDYGNNALHLASAAGDIRSVNWLLYQGLDINAKDTDGLTALHYASTEGHIEVAILLETAGASIWVAPQSEVELETQTDASAESALRTKETQDEVELISKRRVFVPPQYPPYVPYEESPLNDELRDACLKGNVDATVRLLVCGASVYCRNENGSTPLHFAAAGGHIAVCEKLLGAGADVNVRNKTGSTPLHFAADKSFVPLILLLTANGADPCAKNKDGFSPLHFMCTRGLAEVIAEIAKVNRVPFDVHLCGSKDINLLHCSSEQGHANVVLVLLQLGAVVNSTDDSGKTGLHYASMRGHLAVVKHLIEAGAVINAKDDSGNTPLFYACAGGYLDVAKKLQSSGSDLEAKNRLGNTSLHGTCLLGQLEIAQWLAERGASVWAENRNGETPYMLALKAKNSALISWFRATFPDVQL